MRIERYNPSNLEHRVKRNKMLHGCLQNLIVINPKVGEISGCPITQRLVILGHNNNCDRIDCPNNLGFKLPDSK